MQVERKALLTALEEVKPAIASSGSIPEMRHVWWDGTHLFGYNGALGIKVPWEWDLAPGGVLASVLIGFLDSSSADNVDVAATADLLTVKVGRSTAKLKALKGTANPWNFKTSTKGAQFSMELTKELVEGLRCARVIKASDPKRVEHYGVVLFPSKDFLALYSTDSATMAEVRVDGKFSKDLNKLVLPHAYVQQLLGLGLPTTIHFMEDAIMAIEGDDGVQVCSNMMDTSDVWDLPKLADDLAGELAETAIKLPEGWNESLDRATVLAGNDAAYLKLVVSPKTKEATLTGKLMYGSLEERLPIAGKFPAGEITLELNALRALTREAASFAVAERALVINGKNQELYLIAAHEEAGEKKPAREPERKAATRPPPRVNSKRGDLDDEIPF